MLGVTKLYAGKATPGDVLRYGVDRNTRNLPAGYLHYSRNKKPIVVWNVTRRCNLRCIHCYSDSADEPYPGELSTEQVKRVVDDLADFQVPTILWSGGEPLLRPDLFELIEYAGGKGLRSVLSTNGTLISAEQARRLREVGLAYVGISLDGVEAVHDRFRQVKGAFQATLRGIRNCKEAGLRVGLRFTLNRTNRESLPFLFDLLEAEEIPRCCIYHLAYAGRGERIQKADLSHEETRQSVDYIFARAKDFEQRGLEKDILTVDNHTDNVYLYLRLKQEEPARAEEVYQLLRWNGGNQSGIAISCIDNLGHVHADQFSWNYSFGNVKERPFSAIWTDVSEPRMAIYKDRRGKITGKCGDCRFFDICNGNLRLRAETAYGDFLAEDPACYLTREELAAAELRQTVAA